VYRGPDARLEREPPGAIGRKLLWRGGWRMSFTVRLVAAIWLSALAVIGTFTYLQIADERARLTRDLEGRAALLGEGLTEAVGSALARGSHAGLERLLEKFGRRDQGIAVYDKVGTLISATPDVAPLLPTSLPEVTKTLSSRVVQKGFSALGGESVYLYASPLILRADRPAGAVVVFLDATVLEAIAWERGRYNAVRLLLLGAVLSVTAWLVVRFGITRPVAQMAEWTKALRRGQPTAPSALDRSRLFGPVAREVTSLARSLHRAQAVAQEEATLRLMGETLWTEERLKQFVKLRLGDSPLVVVSNREPVRHVWKDGAIMTETPASGLVTAMEPVMRACGGVWVAQGSGDADAEMADARGRLPVPADDPRYTLHRVWLTKEEEAGYYYGFANEGLWPLCHIVHTRPQFRPEDWAHYRAVNEKFAAAALEDIAGAESPMVLIQDYHFALLPELIKRERPDARTAIFWHIPWPNFESFSICPWQDELLLGMLGADLIGFHTQYYCNNFLETAERAIEARIDWEHFSVTRGRHTTYVKPFPISVAPDFVEAPPDVSRQALLERLGVEARFIGIGVERLDYTKGLPERFRALSRFFERYPEYREQVVYVQLAAPSRSTIPRYQQLEAEVDEVVREVNETYGTRRWRPIVYLRRHHDHRDIWPFYRHADFCLVTSLHDGMNLVAKEFVSVRDDEDGVLILSQFAGASSELRDALLVNPYDVDGMAEAVRVAVEMSPDERRLRMARMRQAVREYNIYRWAGLLLSELQRIPEETGGGSTAVDSRNGQG
jgi:alpha,alpha-trehalose-phosphate synthase [UDP-forming]